jgi:hypothetical protein
MSSFRQDLKRKLETDREFRHEYLVALGTEVIEIGKELAKLSARISEVINIEPVPEEDNIGWGE